MKTKITINIVLGMDEFLRVSHCNFAKEMCDTLQLTNEGTIEVKMTGMNILTYEYELFKL